MKNKILFLLALVSLSFLFYFSNISAQERRFYSITDISEINASAQNSRTPLDYSSTTANVNFSSNFQTIVVGHAVTFMPETTFTPPLTYQWSFPGGNPATSLAKNPVVTYNTTGNYDVTLTVYFQGSPTSHTEFQYIHVIPQSAYYDLTGKENNHWYFSERNVFNFDTSNQFMAVSSGILNTGGYEGAASISNGDGNLLFYGIPTKLYNRHHEIMQNGLGLFGGISSTQGILILPQPSKFTNGINENHGKYYVFTADEYPYNNYNKGLRYSVVDMALDNGLGAIPEPALTNKNVLLQAPTAEKLIAVPHANKHDIWIIGHSYPGNQFLAYLLTENGIQTDAQGNPEPAISSAGVSLTAPEHVAGEMAASLDGTKIAQTIATTTTGFKIEVFAFDNQTGIVSPGVQIPNTTEANKYGLEFSPSGRFLYYANAYLSYIKQIDLSNPSFPIATFTQQAVSDVGVLELGPDFKIYANFFSSPTSPYGTLVINNPDLLGAACNVQTLPLPTEPRFNLQNKVPFPLYNISGIVMDSLGQGIGNVEIKEGNAVLAITSLTGEYSFNKMMGWSGSITPFLSGYTFMPQNRTYNNLNINQNNQDYVGTSIIPYTFDIEGIVYGPNGPLDGVDIDVTELITGNLIGTYQTYNGGQYKVVVNYNDSIKIKPNLVGFIFDPEYRDHQNIQSNQGNQNFNAKPVIISISGHIQSNPNDTNLAGVVLNAVNTSSPISSVITDSNGFYIFNNVPFNWSGTIVPSKPGFVFEALVTGPYLGLDHIGYDQIHNDQLNQDYLMKVPVVNNGIVISGRVVNIEGEMPVKDVLLEATGNINGQNYNMSAQTDAGGYYVINNVPKFWQGIVKPRKLGLKFNPEFRKYTPITQSQFYQNYGAKDASGISHR